MSGRSTDAPAERLAVAGRVILAALGGYTVAALSAAFLAVVLPLARPEAVSAGTLSSFAIMAAAIVWAFAARTLARAALALAAVAGALAGALWLAGGLPGVSA